MNKILKVARDHFNEPVLVFHKLGRIVGYAEHEGTPLIAIKDFTGKVTLYDSINSIVRLNPLKGKNSTVTKDGIIWDDYTRVDCLLTSMMCEKEEELEMEDIIYEIE